jgi:hypothetical protein
MNVNPIGRRALGFLPVIASMLAGAPLCAATFVVPPDREMVRQSDAIVVATAVNSWTQLSENNKVETLTLMSVEESIKGPIRREVFEIHEPGGIYKKRVTAFPGVPRFNDGERYLLFLTRAGGVWRVLNLVLGKFIFKTDTLGHDVLLRDSREIAGWDPDGKPHREQNRAAQAFLDFVRLTAAGGPTKDDYLIPAESIMASGEMFAAMKRPIAPLCTSGCSPTTYTYQYVGSIGARWAIFPRDYFYSSGANSAAQTAFANALAAWNNDPTSIVGLTNAGAGDLSHSGGLLTPDRQNTVAFERDLHTEFGSPPFTCTENSYGGTLGIGGVSDNAGEDIGPNGETFYSIAEGDVEMNQGLSTCTYFINLGDFNSAVTHEVGHTLGFRHADDTRPLNSTTDCATDSTLECSTDAIMKADIPTGKNGALQAWDQHAVTAVYPTSWVAEPIGVVAYAMTTTKVRVTWSAQCWTSCHVYRSSSYPTFTVIGSPGSSPFEDTTVTPGTAYLYKVRTFNGFTESVDSNTDLATTVTFTDDPLYGYDPYVALDFAIKAVYLNELRTAVNAVHVLAGLGSVAFTDPTITAQSTVVQAVHISELRAALDAAMSTFGWTTGGYTDSITTGVTVKAVHFQEIRERVK